MALIPGRVMETPLSIEIQNYLRIASRGKVRDSYSLGDKLLVVATDRLSAFDIVADRTIPGKGKCLTTITVETLKGPLKDFPNHLVASGSAIDEYLPKPLRGIRELYERGIVVHRLTMQPYEAIVRGYITGQAWDCYCANGGYVWGHQLPKGLQNGDKLKWPIFTPSNKAMKGHDEYFDINWFRKEYGSRPEYLALKLYELQAEYAEDHGLIQPDTKFEFGVFSGSWNLHVADEINTPDSSRYWSRKDYLERKPGKLPPSQDKQFVRNYLLSLEIPFFSSLGERLKITQLETEKRDHVEWFWKVTREMPEEVVARTVQIYEMMPGMLFGDVTVGVPEA